MPLIALAMEDEQPIEPGMGGDIGRLVKELEGRKLDCPCGETLTLTQPKGYESDSGMKDAQGRTWWAEYGCLGCGKAYNLYLAERRAR